MALTKDAIGEVICEPVHVDGCDTFTQYINNVQVRS